MARRLGLGCMGNPSVVSAWLGLCGHGVGCAVVGWLCGYGLCCVGGCRRCAYGYRMRMPCAFPSWNYGILVGV